MNRVLQLKGRFKSRKNENHGYGLNFPDNMLVTAAQLQKLAVQLESILSYWERNNDIAGALVSVHYKLIIAKSNRLCILLSANSKAPDESVRGAKFVWEPDENGVIRQKHVFTYYVKLDAIRKSIELLNKSVAFIEAKYKGNITGENIKNIKNGKWSHKQLVKTNFLKVIFDALHLEYFSVDKVTEDIKHESIITLFKTDIDTKKLLAGFGIYVLDDRIMDDTTLRLTPEEVNILLNKAPYLISMNVTNISELSRDDVEIVASVVNEKNRIIPPPLNEPIVGVIDTQFDESVYFNEWVEYHNMLSPDIELRPQDYYHGTAVSSIIVDGVRGNANLDDGCGRFRVRHFGVAVDGRFNSFTVMRLIREIVESNTDIKVWNLSLGSQAEIKDSFISPEAAELDRLQSEYDIIFVVAGTNSPSIGNNKKMKIGAPADSLNSMVVNSVNFNNRAASYTRVGPVLSFFHKPDVSYYGGDGIIADDKIVVCKDSLGCAYVAGTSFAAPWISRKLAYLIHIMGLSREVAKALLVDVAAGWNRQDDYSHTIGYGVVPTHIDDIIKSNDSEIRFVLSGFAEKYETYTYDLPVPVVKDKHPFFARATLVYFPQCDRKQGVDYTTTELDLHFGRVHGKRIEDIKGNKQADKETISLFEEDARSFYRKWDNVKHISDEIKKNSRPRKVYDDDGRWGLSIKAKERVQIKNKSGLPFGVVVTLKEMNNVNRIDEFIKLCIVKNWLVYELDAKNKFDIYTKAEEKLELE